MRRFAFALAVCLPALAAAAEEPCAPSPEVSALTELQRAELDTNVDPAVYVPKALAPWRKLLAARPADRFVLQAIYRLEADALGDLAAFRRDLDAARRGGLEEAAALDFEARLAAPDDAAAETKYKEALAREPKSHVANLGYAQLLLREKKRGEAREPLVAALDSCPDDLDGYRALRSLHDKALAAARLPALRRIVDAGDPLAEARAYAAWWQLSFFAAPLKAQPAVRAKVAADVALLRARAADSPSLVVLETLASGYHLLGDSAGESWVKTERARLYPDSAQTVEDAVHANQEERMKQMPHTLAERHAQAARSLETARAWVKKWPRWSSVWEMDLDALLETPHAPAAEVEAATATLRPLGGGYALLVAEAYRRFHLHTDRIPELVRAGLAHIDAERRRHARTMDPRTLAFLAGTEIFSRAGAYATLIDAERELGHKDAARRALAALEALVTVPKPDEPDEDREVRRFVEGNAHEQRGRMALADGHAADALAEFLRAATFNTPDPLDDPELDGPSPRAEAEQAWKTLGGSAATFAYLVPEKPKDEKPEASRAWHDASGPAPPFALSDLRGKKWRLRDLHGKVVVLSFWASWCVPCELELPDVKVLAKRLAKRKGVVFLSVNVDRDPGVIAPAAKSLGIGFPVLLGGDSVDAFIGEGGIPLTVIIDGHGALRSRELGFDPQLPPGAWLKAALEAIDAAAANKNDAAAANKNDAAAANKNDAAAANKNDAAAANKNDAAAANKNDAAAANKNDAAAANKNDAAAH